ncbi:AraC family transcriptional regulator [Variovorax paradoxus]|jgi:AraC-like DNA-binding protein|uniref:helix-turn-helix domain-containing protein n=1 Tax=Variovorax TaxID=34072 RepID=UPI0006E57ED4|nr:AraC family transcriptional regulator [Variovorax sp. CY25R-8]KPU96042.1 AraC family transcriptional regulator [Variovorax paradoxus]KPU96110.1 AraC family transcriptional regulator [Variovorax paradoxus]KPV05068.1 AraC family transcriptional regulator [Variovorax paradoxus]KPV09911.1 AraC family transcriptional regulator [Variovorax paradoxus]KPV14283.1 AraC family transcriptional regulator [Variovorax paradoxus]
MQGTRMAPSTQGGAREGRGQGERLMWLTTQRVFYAGLLGRAAVRTMGGHGVYISPAGAPPNRLRVGGGAWQSGELLVVPPQVPIEIESAHPLILNLLIESESVDPARMPDWLQHCGPVQAPAFVQRVRESHAQLLAASARGQRFDGLDFDRQFFGAPLAPRALDARIRKVIDTINADPAAATSAEECAASVHLSFSRFLHLFKQETGMAFRAFRAWKRARSLLRYVRQTATLTDIALEAGYPDSTHFSHSIRQVYGLKPSDILAGSRRLALHDAAGAAYRPFTSPFRHLRQ